MNWPDSLTSASASIVCKSAANHKETGFSLPLLSPVGDLPGRHISHLYKSDATPAYDLRPEESWPQCTCKVVGALEKGHVIYLNLYDKSLLYYLMDDLDGAATVISGL